MTRKVYSIDVPLWATAYIKADSPEEALKIAQAQARGYVEVSGAEPDSDVAISGLRTDDPELPDVSLSPAMTIHRVGDDAPVELHFDPSEG